MTAKNKIANYKLKKSGEQLADCRSGKSQKSKGFSLIEATIGIALVGIALLGLAQLFTLSMMNNTRSDTMTNATFLAQQQIDFLRNQTATDLNNLALNPIDEQIDVNNDAVIDFRRITQIQALGFFWEVRVQVFPAAQIGVDINDLIQNPGSYQVRADMSTVISR